VRVPFLDYASSQATLLPFLEPDVSLPAKGGRRRRKMDTP
jgi:hypothetical protein